MLEKTIEEQLAEKRGSLEALFAQRKHRLIVPEYAALRAEVLRLERLVARKRGDSYATEWELPGIWEGMTLDCMVLGNQSKCLVIFETKPASGKFRILEFRQTAGYKFTDVSDEIISAHWLSDRGLTAYGAFLIQNSPWIKELREIDRSHPQHDEQKWHKTKHYMLCFKDRMFEAVATDAGPVGGTDSRETAITIALERLNFR